MGVLKVKKLYEDKQSEFGFELISEPSTLEKTLTGYDINRPGLALAGYTEYFLHERIQIFGQTEISYLSILDEKSRNEALNRITGFNIPCIIITKGLPLPKSLINFTTNMQTAVIRTHFDTTPFIHQLTNYLKWFFAPQTHVHGSLVDIVGVGVLLTGKSGIGKSECALDLIAKGHRLVADDIVTIICIEDEMLIGCCNELLGHRMEIRGLGVIDVMSIYGIGSIRKRKRIQMEIKLKQWDKNLEVERLGLGETYTEFLGVKIPSTTIPILPGKHISVLAEAAALNYHLKSFGYHPVKEFAKKVREAIKNETDFWEHMESDIE